MDVLFVAAAACTVGSAFCSTRAEWCQRFPHRLRLCTVVTASRSRPRLGPRGQAVAFTWRECEKCCTGLHFCPLHFHSCLFVASLVLTDIHHIFMFHRIITVITVTQALSDRDSCDSVRLLQLIKPNNITFSEAFPHIQTNTTEQKQLNSKPSHWAVQFQNPSKRVFVRFLLLRVLVRVALHSLFW